MELNEGGRVVVVSRKGGDLSLGAGIETCTVSVGDSRAPRDIRPSIHRTAGQHIEWQWGVG